MRRVVTDVLTRGGHEVVGEAANGAEAVSCYKHLSPDVTTLDITMPGKDGIDALREILRLDGQARVIMCSALGQEGKVLEAIRSGARDFVVKPFEADRLYAAIDRVLDDPPVADADDAAS